MALSAMDFKATSLSKTRTVRELAVEIPNATRVFERLGIDYCCGGGKSLQDACTQAQVSVDEVLRTLEQGAVPDKSAGEEDSDLNQLALKELAEHIVNKHHAYVRQEVPRIQKLLAKVVAVHGKHHPELAVVQQHMGTVSAELTSHMRKEEMVLFPYIKGLEEAAGAGRRVPRPPFGTIRNPVRMMELEHEAAGDVLEQISKASSDYTPPAEACFSYKTLYAALKEFAEDLHQHVHLENNILFPRAIALEEKSEFTAAAGDEKATRCSMEATGSFPQESCCLPQK